jgi:hypothetical protein
MAPRLHSLKIPFFTGTRGCGRRAAVYELFCFCIGVLFGLCATGGINLQFPEQILCPYGGVWRSVVSPSVCRRVRGGAPDGSEDHKWGSVRLGGNSTGSAVDYRTFLNPDRKYPANPYRTAFPPYISKIVKALPNEKVGGAFVPTPKIEVGHRTSKMIGETSELEDTRLSTTAAKTPTAQQMAMKSRRFLVTDRCGTASFMRIRLNHLAWECPQASVTPGSWPNRKLYL